MKLKSAIRLPLAAIYEEVHGLPTLSFGAAPIPLTIICCGFIPARIVSTVSLPPGIDPTTELLWATFS